MDIHRFDALARSLSGARSRRRLFGMLAALPVLTLDDGDEAAAKDRRRRRKNRHRNHQDKTASQRERQRRRERCRPKSRARVCDGLCGPVKSRQTCGKTVDCGSCDCPEPCAPCFVCDAANRTCVIDPAQQGETCGLPGQVCQPGGACACIPLTVCPAGNECGTIPDGCGGSLDCGSCPSATPVCGDDHVCVPCSVNHPCPAGQCCQADGTCAVGCPTCQTCDDGQCVADAALRHACTGPCAPGAWCDAGACAPIADTVRLPDCQGLCDASTEVCGQVVTCPSCLLCLNQTGCDSNSVKAGPLGPGKYCGWSQGSLTCSTNEDCAGYAPYPNGVPYAYCINGSGGAPDHCAAICPF